MTMAEKKILNWVKNRLEMVPAAVRFELYHCPEMAEEQTMLLKVPGGLSKNGDGALERSREIAAQIWETADEHSHAFEGRQRYKLTALDKSDDETGVYVFAIGLGGSLSRAEPGEPTERGLLAQLMRHNQQLASINVEQSQAVNSALMAENRDLRHRVEHVEKQRQEWFELLEDLHSQKHQRELEREKAEHDANNRARAFQLLAQFVPEALSQFKSNKALPPGQIVKSELEEAQETMRRVWRVLDRDWVLGRMDEQNKARIDSLLGIGDKLETLEQFNDRLRLLWGSISDEVADAIQNQIFERDPELAVKLVGLLQKDKEAAE